MTRRKVLILLFPLLTFILVVTFVLTRNSGGQTQTVASPTPSAKPADAVKERLNSQALEIAGLFATQGNAPAAEYYRKLKPFLTKEAHDYLVYRTSRYGGYESYPEVVSEPLRGNTNKTTFGYVSTVRVNSHEIKTGQKYEQSIRVEWEKYGDDWKVRFIEPSETAKFQGNG